ncbi:MAG: CBS domain-containing protein [Rubrivivax sp.]|nr:CBS domain-containing protein [Rubrivivax sp.]MBK8528616.1 CBS domain-containing protein [Rubrivivax sp.]
MRARDIMTTPVISVTPDTAVLQAAALMVEHRINAIVVISGNAIVGIVSEANLLHRYELGTQRDPAARPWWRRLFDSDAAAWSYVEAHAMKVRDIMTPQVFTIEEDTPAVDIAALFEQHKIKQAPVVKAGSVVGIVSRADFVRALVARAKPGQETHAKSDAAIQRALLAELESQSWWHSDRSNVSVSGGVVHYSGQVSSQDEMAPARVAAENIAGVRSVEDSRTVSIPTAGYPAGGYL